MREGEAESHLRREHGREIARAEQPDFGHGNVVGHGANAFEGMIRREAVIEKPEEMCKALGEIVGFEGLASAAKRESRERIRAGGAAESEIDAAGVKRFEDAKRFRNFQRRVIWQHDAA